MSLEGFGDSRRMLTTLAGAAAATASAPSAAGVSSQLEDYQALERMAAQNMVAIKVRAGSPSLLSRSQALGDSSPNQAGQYGDRNAVLL